MGTGVDFIDFLANWRQRRRRQRRRRRRRQQKRLLEACAYACAGLEIFIEY